MKNCCHPERTGPQTHFSFRGPHEQVFVRGVEVGGGESKDLRFVADTKEQPQVLQLPSLRYDRSG
jgi:hypothetical protein